MFEKGDEAANTVSKWTSGAGRNVRWREAIAQAVFNRFPDYNQKCSASPYAVRLSDLGSEPIDSWV